MKISTLAPAAILSACSVTAFATVDVSSGFFGVGTGMTPPADAGFRGINDYLTTPIAAGDAFFADSLPLRAATIGERFEGQEVTIQSRAWAPGDAAPVDNGLEFDVLGGLPERLNPLPGEGQNATLGVIGGESTEGEVIAQLFATTPNGADTFIDELTGEVQGVYGGATAIAFDFPQTRVGFAVTAPDQFVNSYANLTVSLYDTDAQLIDSFEINGDAQGVWAVFETGEPDVTIGGMTIESPHARSFVALSYNDVPAPGAFGLALLSGVASLRRRR